MKLDNTISAIVTGGASGLGEATARKLAQLGVKLAIFDLQVDRGQKLASELGCLFCEADITSEKSVDAALWQARRVNGIERLLVNCAGIVQGRRTVSIKSDNQEIMHHDLASFQKIIMVNLVGTFHMTSKSAAGMASLDGIGPDKVRGVIINTSSVAAEDGQIGQASYAASKAGVLGMTLPIARDLASFGIRVMTIMPGLFHTPMFDGLPDSSREALSKSVPFPSRLGTGEEYANLVVAISENDMLNGTGIRLDGAVRLAAQ